MTTKLRKNCAQNLYVISTQRATIEGLREHPAIRDSDKEFAARMLARCMAQAFEGHAEQALLVLQRVETCMASIIRGYDRMKYATATAGALIFVVIVLLMLVSSLHHFKDVDWFPLDVAALAKYAKLSMLGAIGAFLSVSLGIRRIWIDVDLDAWQHFYAGCSRIIIGVIGALAIGLALDSRFLSPGFGRDLKLPVDHFLAFIAGFSETLVPNRRCVERRDRRANRK